MVVSILFIIIASLVARKKKGDWFNLHRVLAGIGVLFGGVAFIIMVRAKLTMGYPHFKSPHAILGLLGMILLFCTPLAGMLTASGKEHFRSIHKLMGKATSGFMLLAATLGFLRFLKN